MVGDRERRDALEAARPSNVSTTSSEGSGQSPSSRDATCPKTPALNSRDVVDRRFLATHDSSTFIHPFPLTVDTAAFPSLSRTTTRLRSSKKRTVPAHFDDSQRPVEPTATPSLTISASRLARRTFSFPVLDKELSIAIDH